MKYLIISLVYLFLISCKNNSEIPTEKLKQSKVAIAKNTFNFGKINIGDTVNYSFTIKNISDQKLIIDTVGTSCGCTTTSYTRDSIKRNDIAKIEIQYIADNVGKISKSIVVSDNTKESFHVFYLVGTVLNH